MTEGMTVIRARGLGTGACSPCLAEEEETREHDHPGRAGGERDDGKVAVLRGPWGDLDCPWGDLGCPGRVAIANSCGLWSWRTTRVGPLGRSATVNRALPTPTMTSPTSSEVEAAQLSKPPACAGSGRRCGLAGGRLWRERTRACWRQARPCCPTPLCRPRSGWRGPGWRFRACTFRTARRKATGTLPATAISPAVQERYARR
jgi:hypothetical protein